MIRLSAQLISCVLFIGAVSSSEQTQQNNVVLSSVYDAMKENVDRRSDMDMRGKRNLLQKRGFYDTDQYQSHEEYEF